MQYLAAVVFGLTIGAMDTFSYSSIIYCFQSPKTEMAFSNRLVRARDSNAYARDVCLACLARVSACERVLTA